MNKKHFSSLKKNPALAIVGVLSLPVFRWIPDDIFLKIVYRIRTGKTLNLKNPKRFNEKLQWLKLNDRRAEYTTFVDKYAVREYIRDTIGEEFLVPLIGVWDDVESIDFTVLPDKCVLKCTHDSGGVFFYDQYSSNADNLKKKLLKSLKQDFYLRGREWPYKNVKRRIIAEEFIENEDSRGLLDYKFMCFNGEPKLVMVCSARTEMGANITSFDLNWNRLPFERRYPSDPTEIEKPLQFEKMVEIARVLAQDIPFVRVDMYEIKNKVYFGELTMYPACGFGEFKPDEWDEIIGNWLSITN